LEEKAALNKDLTAQLESEDAAKTVSNQELAAQLESEKVAKTKLKGQLDAMTAKNRMCAIIINKNKTQPSSILVRPYQLSIPGDSAMEPTPKYRYPTSNGPDLDPMLFNNNSPWSPPAQDICKLNLSDSNNLE
jgi:hypothetical protein